MLYVYKALVTRVIDGDTFEAQVDLGFGIKKTDRFRLANIDTPETYRPKSEAEKQHGLRAKQFVIDAFAAVQSDIYIRSYKTGKYGRYIADAYLSYDDAMNNKTLSHLLLENGFAKQNSYVE